MAATTDNLKQRNPKRPKRRELILVSTSEYDLIVIGAGAVGENVADHARAGGLTVAIVESELIGGDCSYWACVPSKALLRAGAALRAAEAVPAAAAAITGRLSPAELLAGRNRAVGDWDDAGQVKWLQSVDVDLFRGHGKLTGVRQVQVVAEDGTVTGLSARHAVAVATGSAALLPDIPGLADSSPWTSREATSAQSVPEHLVILGGGVVGVEMATAYLDLGAQVTLIARSGLLGNVEPFAGEAVAAALRERGATILTGVDVSAVRRDPRAGADGVVARGPQHAAHLGPVTVTLSDGATVTGTELLVAAGRLPRTMDLGLGSIGLADGDWLDVDDNLRVAGFDWLYAVGDVNHRVLLTHQGKYQARAAGDLIAAAATGAELDTGPWGRHSATADGRAVPQVVFTDPEVAAVGLTARAAEDAGYRTRVVDYNLGRVQGAALHADGYTGQARMVVDEDRGVVLGMTVVGPDVAELAHAATIAIVGEVPISRLWHAVPSFPTMSEVWLRLLETYGRDSA